MRRAADRRLRAGLPAWLAPAARLLRTDTFRMTGLYVLVFATSALVLGLVVYFAARSALDGQMAVRIETETSFLLGEYRPGGLQRLAAIVNARSRGPGALEYLVRAGDGTALAGELPSDRQTARPGWHTMRAIDDDDDGEGGRAIQVRALVTALDGGALLVVGDDLSRISELRESIARAYAAALGLVVVLGVGGGLLLSRAFLARVDAISRTAEAIIGGDLARRVPVTGSGGDLQRMAATLNRMLDRIASLMDSLRQVSTDVAHDLRTPLSRLYQRLEHARTHAASVVEYEAAVDGAMSEAEGLLGTFSALLRIAQVEGSSPRAAMRVLDLTATVDAVVDAYRPDAEEAGHVVHAELEDGIAISGDGELLTQAVANLVENALRHTPPGTRIDVALARMASGRVRLTVGDDGPGVAPEDLPRLTNRFYRSERSRTTPGNGLGLSLVAAVAELHGATLSIEPGGPGLRVTLEFGAAPGQDQPANGT